MRCDRAGFSDLEPEDHCSDTIKPFARSPGEEEMTENATIRMIKVNDTSESQQHFEVGAHGVTRIEVFTKPGMHADIPYVRVWAGNLPLAEFCQHNIIGVYFDDTPAASSPPEAEDDLRNEPKCGTHCRGGTVLLLKAGDYEERDVYGLVMTTSDLNLAELAQKMSAEKPDYSLNMRQFGSWLVMNGYALEVAHTEVDMGDGYYKWASQFGVPLPKR